MTLVARAVGGERGRDVSAILGAAALSLAASLPIFLVGTLAVAMRADLGFGEQALGVAVAAPAGAIALSSAVAGRYVERIGVTSALRLGVVGAGASMFMIAVAADAIGTVVLLLFVSGVAAALNQPAVNLWLVRTVPPARQGLAFGVKQAAIPAASMLAGLAVPALAVTFGWRWAFAAGGVVAVLALPLVPRDAPQGRGRGRVSRQGDLPLRVMIVLALGMGLGMAAAISFTGFAVTFAVHVGLGEGAAGYLFAAGSLVGIATRVVVGCTAGTDARRNLVTVGVMLLVGAAGQSALAAGEPWAVAVAVPVVFATAWGWPGVFHLVVVRINMNAPAAASGITLTGAAAGALLGPLVFGLVAAHSYPAAWLLAAGWAAVGGVAMLSSRRLVADVADRMPLR